MARYVVGGNFVKSSAEKICERMQGKSYMHFNMSYSNYAGNCRVIVETNYDCSDEELKEFFIYCALDELSD